MNYAALLGVLTAVTFSLPLVARLAEALGLHRNMGVAVSLLLAVLTAGTWYVKSDRTRGAKVKRSPLKKGKVVRAPKDGP